ncbi:redoxin domain-containing protein [Caballeronia udeis]|uniref:Redoxin domain-containing protein n=1 Tax=Caballeronia udeis TaxID=1232866 RepID=A0A158HEY2_9BURK|nr:thioredoxin family protein [Caballeronia udeis]SAL42579.1 redoxin domain-containing protein [Caballeronia udeis]
MTSRLKTAAAAMLLAATALTSSGASAVPLKNSTPAPEFGGIDKWLNSEPLSIGQLRGKVVLVDFWTYTCINCINTLPYVKDWNQKYKDQGLVVIGVHTPEYPFERNTDNVKTAIKRFNITYPVAQDNRYATWSAYNNQYWPAFYLIDKKGQVVYSHFGEGEYDKTEAQIRALLAQKE